MKVSSLNFMPSRQSLRGNSTSKFEHESKEDLRYFENEGVHDIKKEESVHDIKCKQELSGSRNASKNKGVQDIKCKNKLRWAGDVVVGVKLVLLVAMMGAMSPQKPGMLWSLRSSLSKWTRWEECILFHLHAFQQGQCLRKSRGRCGGHEADHEGVVHGIVRSGFAGVVFLLGDLQA